MIKLSVEQRNYKDSGAWKCKKSPTKAHFWTGDNVSITCKYCGEERFIDRVTLGVYNYGNKTTVKKVPHDNVKQSGTRPDFTFDPFAKTTPARMRLTHKMRGAE
jgi:hypothetical protein